MGHARLIADRSLLMLQVHALAEAEDPAVRDALRHGYEELTELVVARSGADPAALQGFFARGQLCHLLTALGIVGQTSPADPRWSRVLGAGIRHVAA